MNEDCVIVDYEFGLPIVWLNGVIHLRPSCDAEAIIFANQLRKELKKIRNSFMNVEN